EDHRTITDRADRSTLRGSVVSTLVLTPGLEDRVEAAAIVARHAPELERRTEEGGTERLALVVEPLSAGGLTLVSVRAVLLARESHGCNEDSSQSHGTIGRGCALEEDVELVTGTQV